MGATIRTIASTLAVAMGLALASPAAQAIPMVIHLPTAISSVPSAPRTAAPSTVGVGSLPALAAQSGGSNGRGIKAFGITFVHHGGFGHRLKNGPGPGPQDPPVIPGEDNVVPVPEPTPLALIGIGLFALGIVQLTRRRRDR